MGEEASGWDRAELVLRFDEPVPERLAAYAEAWSTPRAGEPLQYVLGRWGFRGLDLMVDRRALIPRPETETVVDAALAELRRTFAAAGDRAAGPPFVVDLGTGSGAIALAIATEVRRRPGVGHRRLRRRPGRRPRQPGRLRQRRRPAGAPRRRRWFEALPDALRGRVDLIVSNPPYVAEPRSYRRRWPSGNPARAGRRPTGLEAIGEVVGGAAHVAARPGALVVEVAPHQAEAADHDGPARRAGRCRGAGRPGRPARVLVARSAG